MIVVAIIALLAAIAVPNFLRARKRSQATRILEDLRIVDSAIDQYAIENNKSSGDSVVWADIQKYLKNGSVLYNSAAPICSVTNTAAAPSRSTRSRSSATRALASCPTWPRATSGRPSTPEPRSLA
ncbi:MAG: hypothetical protein WDN28_25485 [Chthoniobacter sp.]